MPDLSSLATGNKQRLAFASSLDSNHPVVAELRAIASAIRRIGRGRCATPEAILIEKHEAAERLLALASRMEAAK